MTGLPPAFIEEIKNLLGEEEGTALIESLDTLPVTSVRLNKRKPGASFQEGKPVTWCKSGLYLSERPQFIFDPLMHAGAYYVQDASSMIYETVTGILYDKFREFSKKNLESDSGTSQEIKLRVLDLCAAPGGKTTAMINALPDGCEIIANEYSPKRVGALRENLEKWGYPHIVTNKDSSFYGAQGPSFDIVAIDAPCSGEGMMRKEDEARRQWSPKLVEQYASLQKEIIKNGVDALKPGGFVIYSTCTFNRKENEENAEFISKELNLTPVDPALPKEWNIPKGIGTDLPVFRFMPHKTQGEGQFIAVFQKPGEWEPSRIKITPTVEKEKYPEVEVDKDTALAYLRRESIKLPDNAPRGLVIITYKNLPLGPAKNIGTRANNLYPKHWRILKR